MNTIYLRTAKAEHEATKLSLQLSRVLSLFDGRSGSEDLAKRAAPSLRKQWSELINELVKGGYIVSNPGANIEPKSRSEHKARGSASASDSVYQKLHAAEQVIAALEAAAAAHKVKMEIDSAQVIATLEAAAAADRAKSDLEAKAKADTRQKAERAARAAELKTFFEAAKPKAAAEVKQSEQNSALAPAELHAAATVKKTADTEAQSSAEVKQRELEKARNLAEFEAVIHAAKSQTEIEEKNKAELKAKNEMHVKDNHRLRDMEIENAALKKLLVEAYMEIATLKAAVATKP